MRLTTLLIAFFCAIVPVVLQAQPGTVTSIQKISQAQGNFADTIGIADEFGHGFAALGDIDNDGVPDIAVGAPGNDEDGSGAGVVFVLRMNSDGTVKAQQRINETHGGFTYNLQNGHQFGGAMAGIGDLNQDGVEDLVVGAHYVNNTHGAVFILFLDTAGAVQSYQEISSTAGNFVGPLDTTDSFGSGVANIGDLDGDGVTDIAVGAEGADDGGFLRGAVWILFLNTDGTVKAQQKISQTAGGFTANFNNYVRFGVGISGIGDLDGDGVLDIAVGAPRYDGGGPDQGGVWILFLNTDGTVKSQQLIDATTGGFTGDLDDEDYFGSSIANMGDINGDFVDDLAVGAPGDDDSFQRSGAIWMLFMNTDGTVWQHQKISMTQGGLTGPVPTSPQCGTRVINMGDLTGSGAATLGIASPSDDSEGLGKGSVWVAGIEGCTFSVAFEVSDTTVCPGDTIRLINRTTCSDSVQWIVNGMPYTNTRDTVFERTSAPADTIQLIAYDSTGTPDSAMLAILPGIIYISSTDTVCGSLTSPSGNYTWTSNGTYTDTTHGVPFCDTIFTFNLTVLPKPDPIAILGSDTICVGESIALESDAGPTVTFENNYSAEFDGNDQIGFGIQSSLTLSSGDVAVAAWVYPGTLTGRQDVVSNASSYTSPNGQYELFIQDGKPSFLIRKSCCNPHYIYAEATTALPSTNQWYHLVGVADSVSGVLTIYVDGVAAGSTSGWNGNIYGGGPFVIGSHWNFNEPDNHVGEFIGKIDKVGVWERTLSLSEIQALSCTIENTDLPTGLLGSWDFEEGSGGSTTGDGPNMHVGTMTGAVFSSETPTCGVDLQYAWSNADTTYQITVAPATTSDYYLVGTAPNGCSVSDTATVWVGQLDSIVVDTIVCDSLVWQDSTYTVSTSHTRVLTSSFGCDSVVTVNLTVNYSSSGTLTVFACDSLISPSGNYTWYATGSYQDTILNSVGCDSVIAITATIGHTSSASISPTACESYVSPSGNYTWTTSGTYADTILNASGCDSLITVNLTVNYHSSNTISADACSSYVSPSGNYTWTASGTYFDTIPNAANCDSLLTINLSINNSYATISPTACDSLVSPSGNYVWTTSGSYQDTIANMASCDSIITVNLTVDQSTTGTLSAFACDSMVSPSGNYTWYVSGVYQDTINNAAGCDSAITITATIGHTSSSSISPTACESYVSPSGNYTWTTSGTYADTILNASGCDSLITVNLTVNYNSSNTISADACSSYVSPSGNYTWTSSGTYFDTIPNAVNCDSLLTINLSINNSYATISPTACDSLVSPSGNYVWTTSGSYQDTIANMAGCDSIITVNLAVNLSTTGSLSAFACDSMVSPSGNYTWFVSGVYQDTINNAAGCDSAITITVTIGHTSSASISPTACESYVSPSGNYTWTTSGTYADTILNASGCDSLITVNLTINYNSSNTISTDACSSYVSPSGNYTWTSSGTYFDTIPNAVNCDSLLTINLSINNSYATISPTACDSLVSPSGNYVWTTSGSYQDTIANMASCDSIITVNLTVNQSTTGSLSAFACDSMVSPSGNYTWYVSGVYQDTINNTAGCDSAITITATIGHSSSASISPTACESYVSPSGNYTWTTSGTYADTILNASGCDSLITVNLMVNYNSSNTVSADACSSYVSPSGNYTWTSSGTYFDTIPNAIGCDSLLTINLNINNSFATISAQTCDSLLSPSGNYVWTSSGSYQDTIQNSVGCDSIVTVMLTVGPLMDTIVVSACDQYVSPSGNFVWDITGTYLDTLVSSSGCDSVLLIDLEVFEATVATFSATACGQYITPSGDVVVTSGQYVDTIANSVGCDSIITLNLTIQELGMDTIDVQACNSYVSPSGNYVWTQPGTYVDTIPGPLGCDSIITISLMLDTLNASIVQDGAVLEAVPEMAQSYQWLDCNNGYSGIPTADQQLFAATANGLYAVEVTDGLCVDTSDCVTVTGVGIGSLADNSTVTVFPNPTRGPIEIDFGRVCNSVDVMLQSIDGRIIERNRVANQRRLSLPMDLSNGTYILSISGDAGALSEKRLIVVAR